MTNGTHTRTYLADLREAVGDLPFRVASDILAGVEEELDGLDDAAAAERIAQLGSPASIAESASRELGDQSVQPAGRAIRRHDAPWLTLATALALLVGGIVIPFVGWLIGVVLLWASRTWTLRDKLIGTLLPPFGGYWLLSLVSIRGPWTLLGQLNNSNPALPGLPVVGVVSLWVLMLLPLVTFVYLLVRARRLKARR